MSRLIIAFMIGACVCAGSARADVATTFNYGQWQSWVGDFTTIDFTGFPNGTPITNQYSNLGVTFTGPVFISGPTPAYPNDGWGLHGPSGVHIYFDEPQSWIAVHHAGTALFQLFHQGQLIGVSGFNPVGGIGSFLGVTSTVQFDEVFITTQPIYGPHIFVDDLHWGAPVPAPGALGLLLIAGMSRDRRRRK